MYIAAVIKNRAEERVTVKATADCEILTPLSVVDRLKYALATNKLLAEYMSKIRPYANADHAIVEIRTDNFTVFNKFARDYDTYYIPELGGDGNAL